MLAMILEQWPLWLGFILFVFLMLALDLGVFHKHSHEVKVKEAMVWSGVWIALALIFNIGVYFFLGHDKGVQFLTGYVIEKSLSVDNLFVFVMVFSFFKVPAIFQHRILFWGILGALVLRAIFIFSGVALINKFHWIIYVFGVFLIYTGIKMLSHKDKDMDPTKNPVVKLFKRFMPVTEKMHNEHFFVRQNGKLFATPLFLVLIFIETTDVIFAVDSIPAILAVSRDPFIVFTSNVFAILGLRSLYFALAAFMDSFHYLSYALCAILVFVGTKMLISDFYHFNPLLSLSIIVGTLILSVVLSRLYPPQKEN